MIPGTNTHLHWSVTTWTIRSVTAEPSGRARSSTCSSSISRPLTTLAKNLKGICGGIPRPYTEVTAFRCIKEPAQGFLARTGSLADRSNHP